MPPGCGRDGHRSSDPGACERRRRTPAELIQRGMPLQAHRLGHPFHMTATTGRDAMSTSAKVRSKSTTGDMLGGILDLPEGRVKGWWSLLARIHPGQRQRDRYSNGVAGFSSAIIALVIVRASPERRQPHLATQSRNGRSDRLPLHDQTGTGPEFSPQDLGPAATSRSVSASRISSSNPAP